MDRSSNKTRPKYLPTVIAWLNSPRIEYTGNRTENPTRREQELKTFSDSVTRERIEPVIEWLNDLTTYSSYRQNRMQLVGMAITRRNINVLLRDCLIFPQLEPNKPGTEPTVKWVPDPNAPEDQREFIRCLQAILYAFERGWLFRLRRCAYKPCGRWFEAKDPRKRFHSMSCKKRSYSESPSSKHKKRKYMKLYMREYRNALYGKGN
jgi:hypothetical protein